MEETQYDVANPGRDPLGFSFATRTCRQKGLNKILINKFIGYHNKQSTVFYTTYLSIENRTLLTLYSNHALVAPALCRCYSKIFTNLASTISPCSTM